MIIEVRAVGLKAMREMRGLPQRQLAHDLGISQNGVPAIEANSPRQARNYSSRWCATGCAFEDLFEVVLN